MWPSESMGPRRLGTARGSRPELVVGETIPASFPCWVASFRTVIRPPAATTSTKGRSLSALHGTHGFRLSGFPLHHLGLLLALTWLGRCSLCLQLSLGLALADVRLELGAVERPMPQAAAAPPSGAAAAPGKQAGQEKSGGGGGRFGSGCGPAAGWLPVSPRKAAPSHQAFSILWELGRPTPWAYGSSTTNRLAEDFGCICGL